MLYTNMYTYFLLNLKSFKEISKYGFYTFQYFPKCNEKAKGNENFSTLEIEYLITICELVLRVQQPYHSTL